MTQIEEGLTAEIAALQHLLASVVAHAANRQEVLTTFGLKIAQYADLHRQTRQLAEEKGVEMSATFIPRVEAAATGLAELVATIPTTRPWAPPRQ